MSLRRGQPPKSGSAKALERVAGKLPGGSSSKDRGRAKGTVGLAALAGAAAVALQNRDKLTALMGRGRSGSAAGQTDGAGRR
jgi:hypothetical protein